MGFFLGYTPEAHLVDMKSKCQNETSDTTAVRSQKLAILYLSPIEKILQPYQERPVGGNNITSK